MSGRGVPSPSLGPKARRGGSDDSGAGAAFRLYSGEMERGLRIALLLGAAFCMPLSAAAQSLHVAAPVAAPLGLPVVPVTFPAADPGSGLGFPTLPGAASLPLLGLPTPGSLSLPAPTVAAPRLAALQTAVSATAARRVARAAGYGLSARAAETAEADAPRPANPLAALQAARILPRLVFDGGRTGKPAADAVEAGPGFAVAGRSGLSRLTGTAPRAAVPLPLPRPSALKRLRNSSWGVAVGFTMLGAGAALMLTPGPGTPFILLGLYLLSGRFAWARQGLAKIRSLVKRRVFHGSEKRMAKLERRLGM